MADIFDTVADEPAAKADVFDQVAPSGGDVFDAVASAPSISHARFPGMVSTIDGGKRGGGLRVEGFTRDDLPDAESVREVMADVSRPAVPLPRLTVNPDDSKTAAVAKTAANLLIGLPEFAESPLGIASLAAGTVIPKTVAGAFLADTTKNVAQQAGAAAGQWDQLTPVEKAVAGTEIAGGTVLAGLLAHGVTRPTGPAADLARELDRTKPEVPATEPKPIVETVAENPAKAGDVFDQVAAVRPEEPAKISPAETKPIEPTAPQAEPAATISTSPLGELIPIEVTDKEIEAMRPAVSGAERAPDVLDEIEAVTSKPVMFDAPDFGQAIGDARASTFTKSGKPSASTQRLDKVISTKDGTPADEVLKGLAESNPKYADWTHDELANAILQSHIGRETGSAREFSQARQLAEEQKRTQVWEQTALQPRENAEAFTPDQLFVGDEFTVNGKPQRVTGFATDAETGMPYAVELEGAYGKQSVPIEAAIHMDAGSLKDVNAIEQTPGRVAASGTSAPRIGAARGGRAPKQPGTPSAPTVHQPQPIALPPTVANTPPPAIGPVRQWLQNLSTGFNRVFAPHAMDNHAAVIANILRDVNGEKANKLAQADVAMHEFRKEFDKTPVPSDYKYSPGQPLPHNYAIIDALERNRSALPPRYQQLAKYFDQAFADRIAVIRSFAPHALQNLIADYFPHIWEDPKRAAGVMQQVATKLMAGKKEFLKQRSLPFFTDGLARGLKPISDNPVDLLLAKMHSMDKFIAFLKWADEAKKLGELKFKYALEETPEGWRTPAKNDPAFNVFAPPEVTIKEAFDAQLRTRTFELLQKLGVKHERLATLGGKRWGLAFERPEQIQTRFAGPESVYWHELGHILDYRYDLQKNFLKQGKTFDAELRALADKRIPANQPRTKAVYNKATGKTQNRPTSFASYVRKAEEKMAVMAEAYVHAPELFQKTAPTVYKAFDQFITDHPELHDIRNIKPSLRLDTAEIQQKLPGTLKLGEWIMRDGPAQVVENYLSPGLSHNPVFRSVRQASNLLNASQLGLSAFHVGFTSLDTVVNALQVGMFRALSGDVAGGLNVAGKAPIAPVANYMVGKAVQRAMIEPSAKTVKLAGITRNISAEERAIADLAVRGGMRATVDPFWQTHMTRNLMRSIREGGLAWAKTPLYAPMAVVEQLMRPIAEYLVPRQKLGVFALLAKAEMDKLGPNADIHQVRAAMAKAADYTEDRMGQMTYDNLFYNRAAKDLALIAFRAYGWQLGKYRHLAGAVEDTAAMAKAVASGKMPELTHRQLYFVALVTSLAAIGGVMHRMFTGQAPQTTIDYLHPSTGQLDDRGNPKRLSLPSYMKDLESDYFAVTHGWKDGGPLGVGKGVWEATYHRANPWVSLVVDMDKNRDFYGTEIYNADDPLMAKMLDQAAYIGKNFAPFSITGAQKMQEGEHSARDYIMPFIGIVPAKQAISMTPAELKAAEIVGSKQSIGGRTKEQVQHSKDVRAAVTAIRQDKPIPNPELLTKMDIALIRQRVGMTPLQLQVSNMSVDEGMAVWDLATPEQQAELKQVLISKLMHMAKSGKTVNTNYVNQLSR